MSSSPHETPLAASNGCTGESRKECTVSWDCGQEVRHDALETRNLPLNEPVTLSCVSLLKNKIHHSLYS